MNKDDLDELERLLAAATPGPWDHRFDNLTAEGDGYRYLGEIDGENYENNRLLVVFLRNNASALLGAARQAIATEAMLDTSERLRKDAVLRLEECARQHADAERRTGLRQPKKSDDPCPKCGSPVVERPACFAWRGQKFPGLICTRCNALYDSGVFEAAVVASPLPQED
jgi:hypothetical protein